MKTHFQRYRLLLPAVITLLMTASAAAAEPPLRYSIDLDAPLTQRAMLVEHLDLYRWQDNERIDESQLQRLVRQAPEQVRTLLSTEGYYAPKITTAIEQRSGSWQVKLSIEAGEPARVRSFDLSVSGPFADGSEANNARLERMKADWSLRPGAVFRHANWEAAKRGALRALMLDGYPAASIVDSQAAVAAIGDEVALQLSLASGPGFTFGPLAISGLQRYPASIVERLSPVVQGAPYSQEKLLELQAKLQDSPYFAGVVVTVDTDPEKPSQVPVQVELTENPARKLGFGIGASTDAGPRGQIDYRDLNIFDRAWRLSGALKMDKKRQTLGTELAFPLSADGYRDSLSTVFERTDIENEITSKLIFGAQRSRLIGKNEFSVGVRYFFEQQEVAGIRDDGLSALVPGVGWSRRAVDNLLYPNRGYLLNVQADVAGKAVLSDRDFLRTYARGLWFYPFNARHQLVLRGEVGAVLAAGRDGIPSDLLFRTGGDQTVRGYAYQSLGVKEGDATVGGRNLAVASIEYVRWLDNNWGVAVFADSGDAADSVDELAPVLGYGFGARWRSPVGPLNLDLAYGRETKQVRLHFSVGFTF